jgi:ribosome-binding protein aMBF1 (putative translation factor)
MTCSRTLVVTGGSVVTVCDMCAKWLSTGDVVLPDIHGDERQHGRHPPIYM